MNNEKLCDSEVDDKKVKDKGIVKTYTAEELAKYFGVFASTIDDWIEEGKFEGINKDNLMITDDTVWINRSGDRFFVRDMIKAFEKESKSRINATYSEMMKGIHEAMNKLEVKYNGKFEEVLKNKKNKTQQEETDAFEWSYLTYMIAEENKEIN